MCKLDRHFPAHYCAQTYCYVLKPKQPSGGIRHIETSWQGALCALHLHAGKHSPPLLQLHPRGNTDTILKVL